MITFNEFVQAKDSVTTEYGCSNEGLFDFFRGKQNQNPRAEDQNWKALFKYFGDEKQANQAYDQAMSTGEQSGRFMIMKFLSNPQQAPKQDAGPQPFKQKFQGERPPMDQYVPGQGRMPLGNNPWRRASSEDV